MKKGKKNLGPFFFYLPFARTTLPRDVPIRNYLIPRSISFQSLENRTGCMYNHSGLSLRAFLTQKTIYSDKPRSERLASTPDFKYNIAPIGPYFVMRVIDLG